MPLGLIVRLGFLIVGLLGWPRVRQMVHRGVPGRAGHVGVALIDAREGASLALRTGTVAVLAGFAAVAGVAALTLAHPGPTWLAVVFGMTAIMTATMATVEAFRVRRGVSELRQRRHFTATVRVMNREDSDRPAGA